MAGTVRPVLFVGCGGSGGVTLRFTMDALRAEVARWNDARVAQGGEAARTVFDGPGGLPRSWQFVHIDVPSAPDGNAADRPPSVPEQGGSYVSVAPTGFEYKTVSDQLWGKAAGKATKHLLAGWMKAPNPATDPVLTAGAGQMRNVGRAVTLYSLPKISAGLDLAGQRLVSAEAREDLRRLAELIGADDTPEPAVFVVSSMSGGAGASMVLDVARVLTRLRPTWLGLTSMFLYTSEVFSSLPEVSRTGVEGNGLAALGELLATSLGANGQRLLHDGDAAEVRESARLEALNDENRLLADLGFAGGGNAESQTFRRVFPIGNTQGPSAALFGDGSMDVVFRSIGRGLAGLVASPIALEEFTSYDMTNPNPIPTDLHWLGSGGQSEQSVLWGSFGFGRLSLGRERYGEYLAQRVAREAVDRLSGVTGLARASAERDAAVAADAAHARLLLDLGVPSDQGGVNLLALLGRGRGPDQARADVSTPIRHALTDRLYKHPQLLMATSPVDFPGALRRVGTDLARPLMSEINERCYAQAFTWLDRFVADVLRLVEQVAARQGLPVARQVVLKLKEDTSLWAQRLNAEGRANAPDGGSQLPLPPAAELDTIAKLPSFGPDHPLRDQLRDRHATAVTITAAGRMATLLGEALAEFGDRVAVPLARALQASTNTLEAARSRTPEGAGVAEARTDVYAEWPSSGGDVPTRFHGAHNEVMLIDPASFPDQVTADLDVIRGARGLAATGEAREAMLSEIITDRWVGHNDDDPSARTVTMTTTWVPGVMVRDPRRPDLGRVATAASFQLRLAPQDVISRARGWVFRPNGELAPFLRQGIRGYLSGPDGTPSARRSAELARKFGVALQHAAPLMQVSAPAFGVVHRGARLQEMFKFSSVPLRSLPGAPADELKDVLKTFGNVADEALTGFDSALDEDATAQHIDIFGSYAPLSPLVVPSLLKPLASAVARVANTGDVAAVWRNRRARPLAGCLAMTPEERRSLVAGYLVGRMTGRLRGTYQQNPYTFNEPLAVFAEAFEGSGSWLRFPTPLLTPHVAGYDSDELAALLEAHLVGLAQCGFDDSLAPLRPYNALRALYGRPTDMIGRGYDTSQGAERYLRLYILGDVTVPDSGARRAEIGAPAGEPVRTAAERRTAALGYMDALAQGITQQFGGLDPARSPQLEGMRYEVRPLLNSLAPDLMWALGRLTTLVSAIDPDDHLEGAPGSTSGVVF